MSNRRWRRFRWPISAAGGRRLAAHGAVLLIAIAAIAFDTQTPQLIAVGLFYVAIVLAGIYIVVNTLLTGLATWVQHKLVGEKNPIDLTRVGNMDGGRAV